MDFAGLFSYLNISWMLGTNYCECLSELCLLCVLGNVFLSFKALTELQNCKVGKIGTLYLLIISMCGVRCICGQN